MKIQEIRTSMKKLGPILFTMIEENIEVTLTIRGNSMYPLLVDKRDNVILTSCSKFNLRRGDIPLYRRNNGQYVLHRIVRVNENSYDLCGDNQYIVEKNLSKENIIAVVKAYERNGKFCNCNNFYYKAYWHLRIFSIPFRYFLHRILDKVRRMF